MQKDSCVTPQKLLPCPVTQAVQTEGAYPILEGTGNIWYCTNCFYCEDVCPKESARQHAINIRRKKEGLSKKVLQPLEQLKRYGTLFPITNDIQTIRQEAGLPFLPEKPVAELAYLYDQVLTGTDASKKKSLVIQKAEISNSEITRPNHAIALFLGCLIPYRILNYEKSTRSLLKQLEIPVCDLPFVCCGSVMTESQSEILWLVAAAFNLAIAEEAGLTTIVSLCGGCTGNLRRVNQKLQANPALLSKVNVYLAKIGKKYYGGVNVWHLSEFLRKAKIQRKFQQKLDSQHNKSLASLLVGTQVPCQVIRPTKSSPTARDSRLLQDLLSLTEIKTIHYPFETMCCGSTMLIYNKDIAFAIAKERLIALKHLEADALILGCGNCSMIYSLHQREYFSEFFPTFFFTEILDYALGGENAALVNLLSIKKQ